MRAAGRPSPRNRPPSIPAPPMPHDTAPQDRTRTRRRNYYAEAVAVEIVARALENAGSHAAAVNVATAWLNTLPNRATLEPHTPPLRAIHRLVLGI